MRLSGKARSIITNLLIALAISVIVNIADILIVMRETAAATARMDDTENVVMDTLTVRNRRYIVPSQRPQRDTVAMRRYMAIYDSIIRTHVPDSILQSVMFNSFRFLQPMPAPSDSTGASVMSADSTGVRGVRINNNRVPARRDYRLRWVVSQSPGFQTMQMAFFFVLSFILVSIATREPKRRRWWNYPLKLVICFVIAVMAYSLAPRVDWFGNIRTSFTFPPHEIYDPTLLLKCSLALVVAVLYGKIYELISQRQKIIVENEVLKSENLQANYNTLINQMNPHFFFNSLNSLSMLVREKHNQQALTYIDRLSDTFRYILQNGASGGTTLEEELKFTDAYKYLLEIRYEGKLFIDFDIDSAYLQWTMPSLTLQPLLENAVKHNIITRSEPLHINIATDGQGNVSVTNTINPKIDEGEGTGIGLKNLSDRYKLLTNKDITIINSNGQFRIILPLIPPVL